MKDIIVVKNKFMQGVYSVGAVDREEMKIYPLNAEERKEVDRITTYDMQFILPECDASQYLKGMNPKQEDFYLLDIEKGIGIIPREIFDSKRLMVLLSFMTAKISGRGCVERKGK